MHSIVDWWEHLFVKKKNKSLKNRSKEEEEEEKKIGVVLDLVY